MSKLEITVSEKGVESVTTTVASVSDGQNAADLMRKTALAVRLLSGAAKSEELIDQAPVFPLSYFDSFMGTYTFRCACGRIFIGPWDEARYESIGHVELHHASTTIKQDPEALDDVIEALITPSSLYSWNDLQEDA